MGGAWQAGGRTRPQGVARAASHAPTQASSGGVSAPIGDSLTHRVEKVGPCGDPRDALEGKDLRGGPRSGWAGGWRRLPKRLGAVTVGYKCH